MNRFCRLLGQSMTTPKMVPVTTIMRSLSTTARISLNALPIIPGSYRREKILGRGRSSGLGKTSGRGQKGQNARSGLRSRTRYEGGQTMLWRKTPKRGFTNINRKPLSTLNIGKLIDYICEGRIDARKQITLQDIFQSNIMGNFQNGVKILGVGADKVERLPVPIHLIVSHASEKVVKAIEAVGGSVKFEHYSRLALQKIKRGEEFSASVAPPRQALRYDMQLYGKDGLAKAAELRLARISRKVRVR